MFDVFRCSSMCGDFLRCVVMIFAVVSSVRLIFPMSNAGARLLVLKSERSLLEGGRVWTPGKHPHSSSRLSSGVDEDDEAHGVVFNYLHIL